MLLDVFAGGIEMYFRVTVKLFSLALAKLTEKDWRGFHFRVFSCKSLPS